ncbi:MAG: M14 family metallopeptidase [Cytophagales bacterium]|nr:M14 family metallopeptidase [Cytophagales bacterium]
MCHFFWKIFPIILFSGLPYIRAGAQVNLDYYLPDGIEYNSDIPKPQSIIGHEVGAWHITHDRLTHYFFELAEHSARVKVEQFGATYEQRPLINVIITSEENHGKLDQIRIEHLKLSDPATSEGLDVSKMPVVVRLGYSVHGNEASGANASVLVAYHLAAAPGNEMDEILKNCIILIDPCLNPDGLQRFSSWVNQHRSKNLNSDPNGREFSEAWPNGRTNHYWFDLNRDWLPAQHPESVARLKLFHDWRPNVQTDHHEMGSDATFFFQPGVKARTHPLITSENVALTEKMGKYHAKALDDHKRLYFTRESFDDFYFGKGSTYPDIHGAIGILFEQASARGHLRDTQNGKLSFPFAIKNHFITSLSTIDAAIDLKTELLNYQKAFYRETNDKKNSDVNKMIIFGTKSDPSRAILLGQVLQKHQIKLHRLERDVVLDGLKYFAGRSFAVPLNQPQQNLIKAIFERHTSFKDSLFYDVSAWDFDLAYNTQLAWIKNKNGLSISKAYVSDIKLPRGEINRDNAVAYVMDWNQYYAPGFVNALLHEGLNVKFASEPFTSNSGARFGRGSILIPVGIQNMGEDKVFELLEESAQKYHLKVSALQSGLSSTGIDLGSNNFKNVRKPTIAMIVGPGVSSSESGEVWHLLDQRYDMHVTMISSDRLDRVRLNKYNVLVLPGGSYGALNAAVQERIKDWVKHGGTLIAWRDALRFLNKLQIADIKIKKIEKDTVSEISYADRSKAKGAREIGGAIFNVLIDNTHPLAYGYDQKMLPVFKRGSLALKPAGKKISNPFKYSGSPLLSGYASDENLKMISGSPAVSISSFGEGKVICFVDNPNFRAFWYGTNRLFMNAIFFGDKISTR